MASSASVSTETPSGPPRNGLDRFFKISERGSSVAS